MVGWIGIAVTAVLGLGGLYFGNSLRRKTRIELETRLLTEATRNIYLNAKRNLTCPPENLVPKTLAEQIIRDGDVARGQASIDQLSLLRTPMRADIGISLSRTTKN